MTFLRTIIVATAATLTAATPAAAQSADVDRTEPTSPGITRLEQLQPVTFDDIDARMQQLRDRHYTTTAAMTTLFANQQGTSLQSWLQQHSTSLFSTFDMTPPTLPSGPLGVDELNFDGFDTLLRSQGFWASDASRPATDPLGQGVLSHTGLLLDQLAAVRFPELPDRSEFPTLTLTAGSLIERAGALLATHAPADYETLVSGLPSAPTTWPAALQSAATSLNGDTLLSPCQRQMIAAMGSGNAGDTTALDPACTPCVAQGVYLHEQLTRPTTVAQTLPPADFNRLPQWRRQAIMADNPNLGRPAPAAATGLHCAPATGTQRQLISGTVAQLNTSR